MGPGIDTSLYVLSMLLLSVYSGALCALEVLSLGGGEGGDDDDDAARISRLLADRMHSGLSLSVARAVAAAATVVTALRFSSLTLSPDGAAPHWLSAIVVVASLLLPAALVRAAVVSRAAGFLRFVGPIVVPTTYLFRPLAVLAGRVLRRGHRRLIKALTFQVLPLKDKIEIAARQNGGGVDEEQRIMSSVVEFGETRVREVMVPRIDIVAVNSTMDLEEAMALVMDAGHSRIPLYDDTIDRVVGVLYTKDLLRAIVAGGSVPLRSLARDPFFVPESKMIDDLLTEFKARKQHLAIVVDEYGGTAGIVTLEDVLEELVGDIQDEFDTEEELVERVDDDTVVCSAVARVDDLNEMLGLGLPEDAAESLGGLVYHMIGRVPRVGESCQVGPLRLEVRSVERQRIDKVAIVGLVSLREETEDKTATP